MDRKRSPDSCKEMDQETFQVMWDLSAPGGAAGHCFMRVEQTEYSVDERPRPHQLEWMPNVSIPLQKQPNYTFSLFLVVQFRYLEGSDVPSTCRTGVRFTTVNIDTPIYLNWLLASFLAAGGTVVKAAVQHVMQIVDGGPYAFSGPGKRIGIFVCPLTLAPSNLYSMPVTIQYHRTQSLYALAWALARSVESKTGTSSPFVVRPSCFERRGSSSDVR
jgi:hypothetical protein